MCGKISFFAQALPKMIGKNKVRSQQLERKIADGFEPQHVFPETPLKSVGKKKPHKKKLAKAKLNQGNNKPGLAPAKRKPKKKKPNKKSGKNSDQT